MRSRGILLTIVVLIVLAIAVFNWPSLTAVVPLDLIVFTAEVPLGITLLLAMLVLASLFFLGALIDRAAQLRQVTQLERQLAASRTQLEQKRASDLAKVEARLSADVRDLAARVDEAAARTAAESGALERGAARAGAPEPGQPGAPASLEVLGALGALEARLMERLDAVEQRVGLVRNELAADIAQSEDALTRRLEPRHEGVADAPDGPDGPDDAAG